VSENTKEFLTLCVVAAVMIIILITLQMLLLFR